jgi:hypothetical protein
MIPYHSVRGRGCLLFIIIQLLRHGTITETSTYKG